MAPLINMVMMPVLLLSRDPAADDARAGLAAAGQRLHADPHRRRASATRSSATSRPAPCLGHGLGGRAVRPGRVVGDGGLPQGAGLSRVGYGGSVRRNAGPPDGTAATGLRTAWRRLPVLPVLRVDRARTAIEQAARLAGLGVATVELTTTTPGLAGRVGRPPQRAPRPSGRARHRARHRYRGPGPGRRRRLPGHAVRRPGRAGGGGRGAGHRGPGWTPAAR